MSTYFLRWIALALVAVALPSVLLACGDTGDDDSLMGQVDPERVDHYIRSDTYRRLVLEIDYVGGQEPDPETVSNLSAGLGELLDKPDGVEVVLDEQITPREPSHGWTLAEIDDAEQETYDLAVDADTIKMHVLFLDGHDARDTDDSQVLGLSWANRNIVIFKESLERTCSANAGDTLRRRGLIEAACRQTEESIWTHEIGHALGLVDNGLPMVDDHRDPDHPHHDHNDECVMYWAYDRAQAFLEVRQRFVDDEDANPLGFDAACQADVAALRDTE